MTNQPTYNQPPVQGPMPPQGPMTPPPGGMMPPQMPPMQGRRMGRRERLNGKLMSGAVMGLQALPNWFATIAVGTYIVALLGVNMLYSGRAMEWYFWLFGIVWVAGFFFLSVKFSSEWNVLRIRKSKKFEKKLFWVGFGIRALYASLIYFFYLEMTGLPYEFQVADSQSYVEVASDWASWLERDKFWKEIMLYVDGHLSDMGYPFFLVLPIYWFGEEAAIIVTRLIQAAFGAYTSVIIYRITRRTMDETTARIAAIFCMLHPVLVCYVGITLKEVLMTFLLVLFIDMADRMLRGKQYTFATIAPMVLVGLLLFMFRTVLGMIAFMAVFFALVMIDGRIVGVGKKITLGLVLAGVLLMAVSDNIKRDVEDISQNADKKQQEISLVYRYGEKKHTDKNGVQGNVFAKYAGAAVFAPLIFTIPFPTMVNVGGQEDMRLIHGGNWMRNVMSGFVILAMFMLLLSGGWRKCTLPLAMMLGYLLMLVFTEFAHSLRFHIPVMPFEMIFAAYAITNMRKKHKMWYVFWCVFTIITCFAWNWFKLAGRGMA